MISPTERSLRLLSLVAVPAAFLAVAAAPADAAPATRAVAGPARIELPDGFRPEGITTVPGSSTFFAGSMNGGSILAGSLVTGATRTLTPGVTGRALRGMVYDPRTRLLWTAGTQGTGGVVLAVDARSGAVRATYLVPDAGFLNDVTLAEGALWVTDSLVNRLTRIPLTPGGQPAGSPTFLPLTGAWPVVQGFGANGIRTLLDGTLLLNNSTAGGLWRVDPATGETSAVPIKGGALTSGDGLELAGNTAYVVRGNNDASVTTLQLGYGRAGAVTAKFVGLIGSAGLDVPSTTSRDGKSLWTINARFGVATPNAAEYWITRLPTR